MINAKIVEFIVNRSSGIQRFHVRVETGPNVCASLMSLDRNTVYAWVTVSQDLRTLQETGFEHRVEVGYPAQSGRVTELRHIWLSAAKAACDLAEATERFIRSPES